MESIAAQKTVAEDNDVYVQCVKPSSPTHSLSGSSHHSGSPRASVAASAVSPVYENIDYYGTKSQPYYHKIPGEVYRKAQPQVSLFHYLFYCLVLLCAFYIHSFNSEF